MLRSPGKITALKAEGTVLEVPATNTDSVNALRAQLSVSGLATELELSFFAVV